MEDKTIGGLIGAAGTVSPGRGRSSQIGFVREENCFSTFQNKPFESFSDLAGRLITNGTFFALIPK
jgi:hypothetical protein